MIVKTSIKLAAFAVAAAFSHVAGAVELSGQYTVLSSAAAVGGSSNTYTFTYDVTNINQGYTGTQTGLDGFTIYIPDSAHIVSTAAPAPYVGYPGVWTVGVSSGLDLSYGNGNTTQNMTADTGYKAVTFWGQYTESVYQVGKSASFSITLSNVAVGENTVGVSSYYGGYSVPLGQTYVSNPYGNYSTFTTNAVSAVAAVPEPETYAMLLAGLGIVGLIARRRRQA